MNAKVLPHALGPLLPPPFPHDRLRGARRPHAKACVTSIMPFPLASPRCQLFIEIHFCVQHKCIRVSLSVEVPLQNTQFSFHGAVSSATTFPDVTLAWWPRRARQKVAAATAFPGGVPQPDVWGRTHSPTREANATPGAEAYLPRGLFGIPENRTAVPCMSLASMAAVFFITSKGSIFVCKKVTYTTVVASISLSSTLVFLSCWILMLPRGGWVTAPAR